MVKYPIFTKFRSGNQVFPRHAIKKIEISHELLDRFEPNESQPTCKGLQVSKKTP